MDARTPIAIAASWRHCAPRIAAICDDEPELLRKFVRAPLAAHHAVAAWLLAHPAMDPVTAAEVLKTTDPMDLAGIDGAAGSIFYRALGKLASKRAHDATVYRRLRDLATSDLAPELSHVEAIDERRIDALETLLAVGTREPLIRALASRLVNAGAARIASLADGLVFLRQLGLLTDERMTAMRRAKNIGAIFRLVGRTLDRAALPGLGVALPAGGMFRSIDTLGRLRAKGLEYRNCLRWNAPLAEAFLLGHKAMIEYAQPDPILVALDVVARGTDGRAAIVCVAEIKGVGNADVDTTTSKAITAAIDALPGIRVVSSGVERLMRFAYAAATDGLSASDDDPELDEAFMEELLADF